MQALVRKIADPEAELSAPTWFNRFRAGHRLADRFREGRAFLAGDAGHVHVPIGGQGMNYGMHDAFNLAWKLAAVIQGHARPGLLDTYSTERHAVDASLVQGTDRAFHTMVEPHTAVRLALKFLGPVLLRLPVLQHRIRDTLAEVHVGYPASPLSEDHGGSKGPSAGDRAPDARLTDLPKGETRQLFNLLQGTRWTFLLFAGADPTARNGSVWESLSATLGLRYGASLSTWLLLCGDSSAIERPVANSVRDDERDAHNRYGVGATPCLYLIRPDGYIGFRASLEDRHHLIAYLERILLPGPTPAS